MMASTRPLDGLTVLDLSRVIKIEHPERGDDTRAWGPPFVGGVIRTTDGRT